MAGAALAERVRAVLAQDRERPNRIAFAHYRPSKEHAERLRQLPEPLRLPRAAWRGHARYAGRFQMPNFHHDFRQELQAVACALFDALGHGLAPELHRDVLQRRGQNPAEAEPSTRSAERVARAAGPKELVAAALAEWQSFEQRLAKHVRIEESWIFPAIQTHYPSLDLSFLVDDHRELLAAERRVGAQVRQAQGLDPAAIERALEELLAFDAQFMDHLGEEEEFVVPLCLGTQHCLLHGPK